MTAEVKRHLGFSAQGDIVIDSGFPSIDFEVQEEPLEEAFSQRDCTILWWNGQYQRPNISITKGQISVSLGENVQRIQLRHVASGAIRYYVGGTYRIPNGDYVLSLWGTTYPHEFIRACVSYG